MDPMLGELSKRSRAGPPKAVGHPWSYYPPQHEDLTGRVLGGPSYSKSTTKEQLPRGQATGHGRQLSINHQAIKI